MQEDSTLQAISTRQLLWDEENRLLGISDNGFVSQYWYDASGERTVKESFDNEGVYINGALSGARTGTSKFTPYISPYMVVSQGGNYTKHVYMGSQRITSKVSNSGIFSTSPVNATDLQAKLSQQTTKIKERFDSLGVQYSGLQQTGGLVSSSTATTADSYFYHTDHLGSSSLITSGSGDLVQHIQYVPFGEVFVEERNATWSTPYKFNGKEQDEETGLCYYGARYYDPRTSVWLSVDPLAEKYPNVGSYVYCVNNPVKFVDPDGREKIIALNQNSKRNIPLINAAKNYPENNPVIHLWGHGTSSGIELNDNTNSTFVENAGQLNSYLMNVSENWKNKEDNSFTVIVLHACETGKGENSFAEEVSKSENFKNVLIVAPNENIAVSKQTEKEAGVYSNKTQKNDGKTQIVKDKKGSWIFYLNGKQVNSMDGDSKPVFNNIEQLSKKYEDYIEK